MIGNAPPSAPTPPQHTPAPGRRTSPDVPCDLFRIDWRAYVAGTGHEHGDLAVAATHGVLTITVERHPGHAPAGGGRRESEGNRNTSPLAPPT